MAASMHPPSLSGPGMEETLDRGPFSSSGEKLATMLLFLSWAVGYASSANLRRDAGEEIHWKNWEPWVCMCELRKQARIRHFVVRAANLSLNPKTSAFWQEKPCSLLDCAQCLPEECPGGAGHERASFARQFERLSSRQPHEVEIPLPPRSDVPTYDSLPVVDYVGDEWGA